MALDSVEVGIGLPFGVGSIKGTWSPGDVERVAAWELYVELVTRVALVELPPNQGRARETLTSLYSLFGTTRSILKTHGPELAPDGKVSFGHLAVSILNHAVRPFLSKWHPLLLEHEQSRPHDSSESEWMRSWTSNDDFGTDLVELQKTLRAYANLLAAICGVQKLTNLGVEKLGSSQEM